MDFSVSESITNFALTQKGFFTIQDIQNYLTEKKIKASVSDIEEYLVYADFIFALEDKTYITRIAAFADKYFSFKPTKEEIRKGHIIIGHRCMPFLNSLYSPDKIQISNGKKIINKKAIPFSLNMAMDIFSFYGEGYVLPYIFNDSANNEYPLSSINYSLPNEITLTAWPLEDLIGGDKIEYGDRILCKITDWIDAIVTMRVVKKEDFSVLSDADIERESWFNDIEDAFLKSFEKYGPCNSIEEQLSFLCINYMDKINTPNCGSFEELIMRSKKIGFSHYGVESRLWRSGETIPFVGEWNKGFASEMIYSSMYIVFSPLIYDVYIKDFLFYKKNKKEKIKVDEIFNNMFPSSLNISSNERKFLLLNIQKRHDILKKSCDYDKEQLISPLRHRIVVLFSKVSDLLFEVHTCESKMEEFPQQEIIILMQLFGHLVRIIEEMENSLDKEVFLTEEVSLSLEGMEESFYEIKGVLIKMVENITYEGLTIIEE